MIHAFNDNDQQQFALISGDYNPMHIDPVFARKSMFGSQVVHGVNIVLFAIEQWAKDHGQNFQIKSLKVTFKKALTIQQSAEFIFENRSENQWRINVLANGALSTRIEFTVDLGANSHTLQTTVNDKEKSLYVKSEELVTCQGTYKIICDVPLLSSTYPNLCEKASIHQLQFLISTSYLVGMKCPGLNSLYSSIVVDFNTEEPNGSELKYEVDSFDERFNLLSLKVETNYAKADIAAFNRPESVKQKHYNEVCKEVTSDEFNKVRALIVGGSRGVGLVSAKILAAGGADVTITYYKGKEDAEKVQQEIQEGGGKLNIMQYNVLNNEPADLDATNFTHLFYYATPFIFSGTKKAFSINLYDKFNAYYISGFMKLFNELNKESLVGVMNPSTIALDEKPAEMKEYVMAKTASEELGLFLGKQYKSITFHKPRLPRMETDQTLSLAHVENKDVLSEMLVHIKKLIENSKLD